MVIFIQKKKKFYIIFFPFFVIPYSHFIRLNLTSIKMIKSLIILFFLDSFIRRKTRFTRICICSCIFFILFCIYNKNNKNVCYSYRVNICITRFFFNVYGCIFFFRFLRNLTIFCIVCLIFLCFYNYFFVVVFLFLFIFCYPQ